MMWVRWSGDYVQLLVGWLALRRPHSACSASAQQDDPLVPSPSCSHPASLQPPNVPDLQVQRMWLTSRQRNATDVTIVTQLSGAPRGWSGGGSKKASWPAA